jgi:hypothetical protein
MEMCIGGIVLFLVGLVVMRFVSAGPGRDINS